jgi:hypothetical protein
MGQRKIQTILLIGLVADVATRAAAPLLPLPPS